MITYVQPVPQSLDDDALTDVLQALVVGLTGLDASLVRPRWQPQPPTQPDPMTNWCAIGITTYTGTDYPEVTYENETGTVHRLERLDVLASFYGPGANTKAKQLREGVYIWQNYALLARSGIKLRGADEITHMPELVNTQYVPRSDVPISFMRMAEHAVPVASILKVPLEINADNGDRVVCLTEE